MKKVEQIDPLEGVPGPSPWYLRGAPPPLPGFEWRDPGSSAAAAGKVLLTGPQGLVLILDFYNWVLPLDDARLLIWHQPDTAGTESSAPVRLLVLRPGGLPAVEGRRVTLYETMNESGAAILIGGAPEAELLLNTAAIEEDIRVEFPAAMAPLDELLLMCHSSGARVAAGSDGGDLALLVANPRSSSYRLYPQDWFNQGDYDYDFEWVTRVRRNPATRRVEGDGIRLLPFTLDETLCALAPDT